MSEIYRSIFLRVPLNCDKINLAIFWKTNWWEVAPMESSCDVNFSEVFGSIYLPKLLRKFSVGVCSAILSTVIWAGLAARGTSVPTVGSVLSGVSVLSIFGFEVTEVVYVSDWKPTVVFCYGFWAVVLPVTIDWLERIRSVFWSVGLFEKIVRVIIIGRIFGWE